MGAVDYFNQQLIEHVKGKIGEEGQRRLGALIAARSVRNDLDVYDHIRLARYILTESENEPALPDDEEIMVRLEKRTQTEDYPFQSGDVFVLGPEVFVGQNEDGDDVICWQGVNFVRQVEPLTGVVGPDPEFEAALAAEETPVDTEREPAPSAGNKWRGLRGGRPD